MAKRTKSFGVCREVCGCGCGRRIGRDTTVTIYDGRTWIRACARFVIAADRRYTLADLLDGTVARAYGGAS